MALTITIPAAGAQFGPGYAIRINQTTLPMPVDDYLAVSANDPATGFKVIDSIHLSLGNANAQWVFGAYERMPIFSAALWAQSPDGAPVRIAPGANVDLHAYQFHANGVLVSSSPVLTAVWDPTSYLAAVVQWFGMHALSESTDIAKILAAVYRVFPTS